jgi:Tfp pilus assembly protein PilO
MTTPVRRGSWIVILPLAAVAAAYVVFFFLPGRRAIAELRQQARAKQDFVAEADRLQQTLRDGKQEMEKTQAYVAACRRRIPDEKELGTVFGRIHQVADAAGIRITRFDPQPPVVYETLRRVPVLVGCSGSFAQMYEFLRNLEALPTSLWVGSLKAEKDGRNAKNVQCEVGLAIFAGNSGHSDYVRRSE